MIEQSRSGKLRKLIQIAVIAGFAFLLWRFFPFAVGFLEGAAFSIRRFWWVVLLILLGSWLYWVLSKRNPG